MKKIALTVMTLLLATTGTMMADNYETNGDGTTWTLTKLAATTGTGVTEDNGVFTMANTVVIKTGDTFQLVGGETIQMEKGISLEIEGKAQMTVSADRRVLFTRSADGVVPGVVYLKNNASVTTIRNVDFEYAGLKNFAEKGLVVDSCTFRYHAASLANGSSAINMGGSGAEYVITNCIFEKNARAGIGGAANSSNPVRIENCQFLYNGTANLNYPQINVTAATQVTIRNCVVLGDREKTRVGGIVVSNLTSAAKDGHLLIEGCTVKDCRFGISVYSDQTAIVRNNVLINNNTETTPNNGGSGINITDASGKQNTMLTGNFIMGSLWGVTVYCTGGAGTKVNLGRTEVAETDADYNPGGNVFYQNGNNNKIYDLYNNSVNTVYAQNNHWLTAASFRPEAIDDCIYDKKDQASLGDVIYQTPIPTPTAIATLQQTLHQATTAIYRLDGMRTDRMQRGLNIVTRDGRVTKVVQP